MSSIEQIRNDLENDDIFTLMYRGGQEAEEKVNTMNEDEKEEEKEENVNEY